MALGDTARKYLDFLESLENDEDYEKLGKLRYLPINNAEEIYNEAVKDFLDHKLKDVENE